MSLEEKVALLSGRDFWSTNCVDRLNIPSLKLSDGPTGLRSTNSDPATVFPVGVALAATWNPDLVEQVAAAIGREGNAYDVDVLLAPGMNIQRTPLGGRNFEYFSEDPHLTGVIASAYVRGVQSMGVGACIKHFAVNNQERNRMSVDAVVAEPVLRDTYLAGFEATISQSKPWMVMSAYNKVNGVFASENRQLLREILKDEWGFDGVVVSDWRAARSTVGSAIAGLDLEMPGPPVFYGTALKEAVENEELSEAVLDDHLSRMLLLVDRCRAGDTPKPKELSSDRHRQLARKAACEGAVLLKNENSVLPLKPNGKIAVLGSLADSPAIQGGGSSQVTPGRIVSPLEGLIEAMGTAGDVVYHRGVDVEQRPATLDGRLLSTRAERALAGQHGLSARYFRGADFEGEAVDQRIDWRFSKLGFGEQAQDDQGCFSVEWTGFFIPRYSGVHHFTALHSNPDIELILGGEELIGLQTQREKEMLFMILPLNRRNASIELVADQAYPITTRYRQSEGIKGFNIFNLALREPKPDTEAAIELAQESDQVVLFVGSGTTADTEGEDRASLKLGDDQTDFIENVLEVCPNTIVVVNTGGPIEMPWAQNAKAVLQVWLPGQEGGHAIADILMGNVSPSGKLPATFPAKLEDHSSFGHYPGDDTVQYEEGSLVGYRHVDAFPSKPLFPFGHGLTYSSFDLELIECPDTINLSEEAPAKVRLRNTGDRRACEVVQIYLTDLAAPEEARAHRLCGFAKQDLDVDELYDWEIDINAVLGARAMCGIQQRSAQGIRYLVQIGFSSHDIRVEREILVETAGD